MDKLTFKGTKRNFDVLTKSHKISAKAESIEAFKEKAGI